MINSIIDKKDNKKSTISKKTKRLGIAKEEIGHFDLSQEEFDSIPIDDFYNDEK